VRVEPQHGVADQIVDAGSTPAISRWARSHRSVCQAFRKRSAHPLWVRRVGLSRRLSRSCR
jgi:hypothetical protein